MSDINKYKNILLKIYNNYIFLGLSYEKFETIALNFSSESFKNKESFEKQITSFLDKYVKNEINKNPKIIEKYIDANYKNFENYGKCYNFMKTFITFLETYEFNFDYEITNEEDDEDEVIVKRKNVEMKPMDEEEAILQMNLLGHEFFVYKDMHTNNICVLYKRKDGNYGLIETK